MENVVQENEKAISGAIKIEEKGFGRISADRSGKWISGMKAGADRGQITVPNLPYILIHPSIHPSIFQLIMYEYLFYLYFWTFQNLFLYRTIFILCGQTVKY